jgi:hypothetical protein
MILASGLSLFLGSLAWLSSAAVLTSDSWFIGRILGGRHPWRRNSAVDTTHAILHDDTPPVWTAFAGILDKLYAKIGTSDTQQRRPYLKRWLRRRLQLPRQQPI